MIKKSTKIKEIYFDSQSSAWNLALDALRENSSITRCSIALEQMPKNISSFKAIAEYLSFCKVKSFALSIDQIDEAENFFDDAHESIANAIKSNHYIEDISFTVPIGELMKIKTILKSLKAHPTLKRLEIIEYSLSTESMDLITDIVNNTPNIACLSLTGSAQQEEVRQQIVNLTRVNKNLTRYEFAEVFYLRELGDFLEEIIKSEEYYMKGLYFEAYVKGSEESIEKFFSADLPIESIGFRYMGLPSENTNFLARGLLQNTRIKELDLRGNNLIDGIMPVLKHNRSITSVDFRGNSVSEESLAIIADVLKNNSTLRVLKLGPSDTYTNCPLNILWKALKETQHIVDFELTYLGMYPFEIDVQAVKNMMDGNRSITKFKLGESIMATLGDDYLEIANNIQTFTERNKLEQRLNITNTLQTIAMISKQKVLKNVVPKEIWQLIFSYVSFPGVELNFANVVHETQFS